jgi:SAM-dependent methyltransferase
MNPPIIETTSVTQTWRQWLNTPAGSYLLNWEQSQMDTLVADIFGYHALQLGMPELAGLRANRMPHQWLALSEDVEDEPSQAESSFSFAAHSVALPFSADSLDLLLMPHSLELSLDAHASLREAERVLMPEGHLVITGLNPASLWGWRHQRAQFYKRWGYQGLSSPPCEELIGYWRLRDWLKLLGFEVKVARFGCWRPALDKPQWFQRLAWIDKLGANWWPILGGAYVIVAIKKVQGGRILGATWKRQRPQAKAAVTIAQSQANGQTKQLSVTRKTDCESR